MFVVLVRKQQENRCYFCRVDSFSIIFNHRPFQKPDPVSLKFRRFSRKTRIPGKHGEGTLDFFLGGPLRDPHPHEVIGTEHPRPQLQRFGALGLEIGLEIVGFGFCFRFCSTSPHR